MSVTVRNSDRGPRASRQGWHFQDCWRFWVNGEGEVDCICPVPATPSSTPDPRTPSTDAGRRLLEAVAASSMEDWVPRPGLIAVLDADIPRIEAEARADLFAQIEKAVLGVDMYEPAFMHPQRRAVRRSPETVRDLILAAIRSAAPVEPT